MGAEPLLSIQDVSAGYGRVQVLHGVSLDVHEGEFVTIVGANGAGKTTLLRVLMGLLPASGAVMFAGRPLLRQPAHKRVALGIGYIPEGRHVFPALTVEENLRLTASIGHDSAKEKNAIERVYRLFPRLAERRWQEARSLSGGEQQMLALGRALALDPAVLIADEISLGLAPIIVDHLFEIFAQMHREGTTILLAEQNARLALEVADVAYVLETGRITLHGPAVQLKKDKRVVEAYLQTL